MRPFIARFTARKLAKYQRQSWDYKILGLAWSSLFLTGGSALLFLAVSDKSWDSVFAPIAAGVMGLFIILGASAPFWNISPALDVDSSGFRNPDRQEATRLEPSQEPQPAPAPGLPQ